MPRGRSRIRTCEKEAIMDSESQLACVGSLIRGRNTRNLTLREGERRGTSKRPPLYHRTMEVQSTFNPDRKIHGIGYGSLRSFCCRSLIKRGVSAYREGLAPTLLPRATKMQRGRDVKPDFSVMVGFTLGFSVYEM